MITEELQKKLNFESPTAPYEHQSRIYHESASAEYYALFWEMGTGKSKLIVDTAQFLFTEGEIDGLLIISDKGQYLGWHYEEFQKHWNPKAPLRSAFWASSMSSTDTVMMNRVLKAKDDFMDVLCINVESFGSSSRSYVVAAEFLKNHYAMMVVDECTSIKNPKAKRTEAICSLGLRANYRRILSGTPITQGPLDLYSQFHFLKPGCLGFTSFVAFRAEYAEMWMQKIPGRKPFYTITGYKNIEKLRVSMESISSRILKSECLDLPDKVYETNFIELTPEQRSAYESLVNLSLVQLEQGLLTSTSALTAINKLQQICCGHLKLDDDVVVDLPSNRVQAVMDLADILDEKIVVWCAFQRDVELLMAAIEQRPRGYGVHYYGKTTDKERKQALEDFSTDPECLWFVGTGRTGGKGINQLVVSRYTIYYSNTYHLETRLQSEDREHRIGQTRNVTYFDFVAPRTVDVKILKALKSKRDIASTVLDDFRELVEST